MTCGVVGFSVVSVEVVKPIGTWKKFKHIVLWMTVKQLSMEVAILIRMPGILDTSAKDKMLARDEGL